VKFALLAIGLALMALTLLSQVRSARWWIRFTDFPRLQIALALSVVAGLFAFQFDSGSPFDMAFMIALLGCLAYQGWRILPYTAMAPRQVHDAERPEPSRSIRILVANVLMENRKADDFLALVREADPDLVLAMETDSWWDGRLRALERDYPHAVRQPQENHYGIHLFSRLALEGAEICFLVDEDVPSIRAQVALRSGDRVAFHGLHPRPPLVQQGTEQRDAELLIVGRQFRTDPRPTIVAGDLNDVAWSRTTRLFQRISGLLDPRRGRGLLNTYHAGNPLVRWPLDHVFHDVSFALVRLQRLRSFGSDHFPVLVELHYSPCAAVRQEAPAAEPGDQAEARETIAIGRATQARVS